MTKVQSESRVYVRWPVAGIPAGSPLMHVRFDRGPWHDLEYVYTAGVAPTGTRILVSGPLFVPDAGDMTTSIPLGLGSHSVEFRFADVPERIIANAGTIDVVEVAPPEVLTWGVTVGEVAALAPHIDVADSPELDADDMFAGSNRKVRRSDVARWIINVSAMVDARLQSRGLLTSEPVRELVYNAAHTIVVNGAAEYLVSAAFPMKAGVNDATSYSAELHRRYEEGLAAMSAQLDEWLKPGALPDIPGSPSAILGISGAFPVAAFPDAVRW